ncbi:hypothetical protein EYF80_003049 [Liparis tanakae]|uniref:Uncharacterized protein n=1 Tax=Liparis tanakae TaxID=230148 RepID=A0A4Z2J9G5_9TELE|nr:hypothetical protein EYF80_003049 [Liparis tanakae]
MKDFYSCNRHEDLDGILGVDYARDAIEALFQTALAVSHQNFLLQVGYLGVPVRIQYSVKILSVSGLYLLFEVVDVLSQDLPVLQQIVECLNFSESSLICLISCVRWVFMDCENMASFFFMSTSWHSSSCSLFLRCSLSLKEGGVRQMEQQFLGELSLSQCMMGSHFWGVLGSIAGDILFNALEPARSTSVMVKMACEREEAAFIAVEATVRTEFPTSRQPTISWAVDTCLSLDDTDTSPCTCMDLGSARASTGPYISSKSQMRYPRSYAGCVATGRNALPESASGVPTTPTPVPTDRSQGFSRIGAEW